MIIDQAIARVRAYREFSRLTVSGFATLVGMNESTLRGMDGPDWSPNVSTLRKLEEYIAANPQPRKKGVK